jgi:gamma-glutamylcyclotransferase (GGCT)/AIG2-like uncharacterized protein YtfP
VKTYLFSYGTLQEERTQLELFGKTLKGSADILKGYTVASIEIKDEKFLAKGEQSFQSTAIFTGKENDRIKGTVLEITEEDLRLADKYEPDGYDRVLVKLKSGIQSWIYLVAA